MAALFSAELSKSTDILLTFTPSNKVSRKNNVYEVWTGEIPSDSYWEYTWGGFFDIEAINQVQINIGGKTLSTVNSLEDCCIQENSIYDEPSKGMIYINVPLHPWLYEDVYVEVRKIIKFLSGPKSDNPSDDVYYGEHWPVRLETPKFNTKLSDVVNGLVKYSTFDFTLFNDDGYFDNSEINNYFNSQVYIRKTWKDNPSVEDFIPIRNGFVETIKITDKNMTVSCSDLFRSLDEPITQNIKDLFPEAVENRDEELPVIYGTVKTNVIEIDINKYIAGENISGVLSVYDKNDNPVSDYSFDTESGIITTNDIEIKSAVVNGNPNNKIGEIIKEIISKYSKIKYISSFWDIDETNLYINNSPRINIMFKSDTVKNAIKKTLESDMAFLIQKNDGRFTLRKWKNKYNYHKIDSWLLTKFPTKDFSEAQKSYFNSCLIYYNLNYSDNNYKNNYLYDKDKRSSERLYNKNVKREFETNLINEDDVRILAELLSNRFSKLKETVKVYVGYNTSEINLLDTVELKLDINGRKFSKNKEWIVKEIDPAQDILTFESIY
jgi:hypothetical protein